MLPQLEDFQDFCIKEFHYFNNFNELHLGKEETFFAPASKSRLLTYGQPEYIFLPEIKIGHRKLGFSKKMDEKFKLRYDVSRFSKNMYFEKTYFIFFKLRTKNQ
jgi:hypothetical protein